MKERRGEPVRDLVRVAVLTIAEVGFDDISKGGIDKNPRAKPSKREANLEMAAAKMGPPDRTTRRASAQDRRRSDRAVR
jgi:hypothetical protein